MFGRSHVVTEYVVLNDETEKRIEIHNNKYFGF